MRRNGTPTSSAKPGKKFKKQIATFSNAAGCHRYTLAHESTFLCHLDGSIRGHFRPRRDPGRGWREEILQEPLWLSPRRGLRLLSPVLSGLWILSPVPPKLLSAGTTVAMGIIARTMVAMGIVSRTMLAMGVRPFTLPYHRFRSPSVAATGKPTAGRAGPYSLEASCNNEVAHLRAPRCSAMFAIK